MNWHETKAFQWVIAGVALTFAVGLGLLVGTGVTSPFSSKADSISTSSSANNELPSASSASIDGGAASITLTENDTTTVTCTATVTDNNGCDDLDSVSYALYRSSVAGGAACTPDNANCYTGTCTVDGGSCTGGTDLTATVTCDTDVFSYADPTDAGTYSASDWSCTITPSDGDGAGSADTDTAEVNTLAALDVTASIAYGALDLGSDTGATNQSTVITNTGNVNLDVEFSGTSMACDTGSIPSANQKYDTSDVTYASLSYALSDSAVERDLDIAAGAASTDTVYWGLAMPSSAVDGSCSGTNTVTAAADHAVD